MSHENPIEPVQLSIPKDYLPEDLRLQIDVRLEVAGALDEIAPSASSAPPKRELIRLASGIYRSRRSRDRILDDDLFGEPAWDMMLALYCIPALGEPLSVTALNYSANVAQTTGLRVQSTLLKRGLIQRRQEESDGRRQIVSLTAKGEARLEDYLLSLIGSNLANRCLSLSAA